MSSLLIDVINRLPLDPSFWNKLSPTQMKEMLPLLEKLSDEMIFGISYLRDESGEGKGKAISLSSTLQPL